MQSVLPRSDRQQREAGAQRPLAPSPQPQAVQLALARLPQHLPSSTKRTPTGGTRGPPGAAPGARVRPASYLAEHEDAVGRQPDGGGDGAEGAELQAGPAQRQLPAGGAVLAAPQRQRRPRGRAVRPLLHARGAPRRRPGAAPLHAAVRARFRRGGRGRGEGKGRGEAAGRGGGQRPAPQRRQRAPRPHLAAPPAVRIAGRARLLCQPPP